MTQTPIEQAIAALEPCPRCGNRAFVTIEGEVWCVTDRCLKLPPRETKAEAITAWNTRATLSALKAETPGVDDKGEDNGGGAGIRDRRKSYDLPSAPVETASQRQAREAMRPGFGSAMSTQGGQSYNTIEEGLGYHRRTPVEGEGLREAARELYRKVATYVVKGHDGPLLDGEAIYMIEKYLDDLLAALATPPAQAKGDAELRASKALLARAAVEELANTNMNLSLERWGHLSRRILDAIAATPPVEHDEPVATGAEHWAIEQLKRIVIKAIVENADGGGLAVSSRRAADSIVALLARTAAPMDEREV